MCLNTWSPIGNNVWGRDDGTSMRQNPARNTHHWGRYGEYTGTSHFLVSLCFMFADGNVIDQFPAPTTMPFPTVAMPSPPG